MLSPSKPPLPKALLKGNKHDFFSSTRCVSELQPKSHPLRTIERIEEVVFSAFLSSPLIAILITEEGSVIGQGYDETETYQDYGTPYKYASYYLISSCLLARRGALRSILCVRGREEKQRFVSVMSKMGKESRSFYPLSDPKYFRKPQQEDSPAVEVSKQPGPLVRGR